MAKRKRKDTGLNLTPLTASEVMGDIEAELAWLEMARRRMEELRDPQNRNITHDIEGDPVDWTEVMKHGLRGGDPIRTYGVGAAMPRYKTGRAVEGTYGSIQGMAHAGRPPGEPPGPSPISLNTQTLQGHNIPRPDVNVHRSQRNRQADFEESRKQPMIDTLMHELGHRSVDIAYPTPPGGGKASFVDEGKYDSPEHRMIRAATRRRGYHDPKDIEEARAFGRFIGKGYGDWDSKTQKFTKSKGRVAKSQLREMRRYSDMMQELRKKEELLRLKYNALRNKKPIPGFFDPDPNTGA
jgi:hypothetical protein